MYPPQPPEFDPQPVGRYASPWPAQRCGVDCMRVQLPVRQWVLPVPKRLRYHVQHDPAIKTLALRIFLSVAEQALRRACPAAGPDSRIGAVAFIHRSPDL